MSKRATVEPAWLNAMLVSWGMIKVRQSLGFPTESLMFKERVPSPARSYEPTGYCEMDFRALEAALDTLDTQHKYAILHCFKPWTAESVREAFSQEFGIHWAMESGRHKIQRLLHEAAALIRAHMDKAQDVIEIVETRVA